MKRKNLEWILGELESFSKPKLGLEQYATSPELAGKSAILYAIDEDAGLEDATVCDLGCGCGVLMIGAAQFEPSFCYGVDVDADALDVCRANRDSAELTSCDLLQLDITTSLNAMRTKFDIVVMNPPFGTKNNAGIDVKFVKAGLSLLEEGGSLYSLHKTTTRKFLLKSANSLPGVEAECLAELKWNLDRTYRHQKKDTLDIAVDLIKYSKVHL